MKPSIAENLRADRKKKIGKQVLFLLFLVYIASWFMQLSARVPLLEQIRFDFILAIVLFAGIFISPKKNRLRSGLSPYVTFYLIVVSIHVLFSYDIGNSIGIFVNDVLKLAAIGLFITHYIDDVRDIKLFVTALLLGIFKVLSESTIGALDGSMIWYNQGIGRLHGSVRMWGSPNSLASLSVTSLTFPIFLFAQVRQKLTKAFLVIFAISALVCLVFAGSRSGYVGFAILISTIVLLVTKHKFVTFGIISVAIIASASFFLPQDYKDRISTMFTGEEIAGDSMGARMLIIDDAVEIFLENPLGVGVGNFPLVRGDRFGRRQDTHNLYLQALTNIGIHGLIAFLLMIGMTFRLLLRTRNILNSEIQSWMIKVGAKGAGVHAHQPLPDLRFLLACCNILITYLTVCLALGMFGHKLYEVHWWFVLGAATVVFRNAEKHISGKSEITKRTQSTD